MSVFTMAEEEAPEKPWAHMNNQCSIERWRRTLRVNAPFTQMHAEIHTPRGAPLSTCVGSEEVLKSGSNGA